MEKVAIAALVGVLIFFTVIIYLFIESRYLRFARLPKLQQSPAEWDTMPITSMNIRTSHNSYLNNAQYGEIVTTNSLKRALEKGARCVELDVGWKDGKPVVAHGTADILLTTSVPLSDMLNILAKHAFEKVNDPLVLTIEFHDRDHEQLGAATAALLAPLPLMLDKNPLSTIPLGALRHKIIVLSNSRLVVMDSLQPNVRYVNMGSEDPNNKNTQGVAHFNRIFPADTWSILGVNLDAIPFMGRNFSMVSMNFGIQDDHFYNYLKAFGPYGLKPFAVQREKNVS